MSIKGKLNYFAYKMLPRNGYLRFSYWYYHRKNLHINSPKRFSEKLFLLKIYNGIVHKDLIQQCYDKYTVRKYVSTKIGEKYLTHLYGVWEDASKIDFEGLPEKCVFKISQSSGCNIICQSGYKNRQEQIRKQLQEWLDEQNNCSQVEEISKYEAYCCTYKSVIICEELLELANYNIPDDIRFYCFNGKVEFISIDYDTVSDSGEKLHDYYRNVFDINGNFWDVEFGRENNANLKFPQIDNLEEMVSISQTLAEPFEFARIDLYNVEGRIVFGEITWIPMGGAGKIQPDTFDYKLGEKLDIPNLVNIINGR